MISGRGSQAWDRSGRGFFGITPAATLSDGLHPSCVLATSSNGLVSSESKEGVKLRDGPNHQCCAEGDVVQSKQTKHRTKHLQQFVGKIAFHFMKCVLF